MQILDKLIKTRWNALPREQCDGIKNYVVSVIIKTSSDPETMRRERVFLGKLNLVLVQILKYEWPKHWPTFISEIVSASRSNLSLCENNMAILKLLSEEVFDFSAEQMTTVKAKNLKMQLCNEFSEIYQLSWEVLERGQHPSLLAATLEALLRFLKWIPLGYIFETELIDALHSRFLPQPAFRNSALQCLTEIASLTAGPEYEAQQVKLFLGTMGVLQKMIPYTSDLDLVSVYRNSSDAEQRFLQNLALFLTACLGNHAKMLESQTNGELVVLAHLYLLRVSLIDDREVFKVCLEYWNKLVSDLYHQRQSFQSPPLNNTTISNSPFYGTPYVPEGFLSPTQQQQQQSQRHTRYSVVLEQLRLVMIERMVKPEEVLVVEDENGEIVRERQKETDTVTLYKAMREVLVFLTHLGYDNTEAIMTEKLGRQFDGSEWNWASLNRLCWAIGSISGAMNEEVEKRFLVNVIRDLLGLCEMKRGKDNKAVVASNIMYVVGQYPRFMKAHWKFLKTVINKLFEFMHETHEGVQDMACDTFIKIAKKCKRHFIVVQPGESGPFAEEIIMRMPSIICDLQPGQVHVFYAAVGHMLQAQTDPAVLTRQLAILMELPNQSWDTIIASASQGVGILQNTDTLRSLANILKTNISVCSSVGAPFVSQISRIYMDMLSLYRAVSNLINEAVGNQGILATRTPIVRAMRTVKKDILRLVDTFVGHAEDLPNVARNFAPALFEATLGDYGQNVEQARDAEVLSVTATVVSRLGPLVGDQIPAILDAVFAGTLAMISKDFSEYPEHRTGLFKLLQSMVVSCYPAIARLPPTQLKLVIDSIVWAFKHTHRDISDTGLQMALQLMGNVSGSSVGNPADSNFVAFFYSTFYLALLQDIFYVLTDTDHKASKNV